MRIKFWGVRGSIPAPLDVEEVRGKMQRLLKMASLYKDLSSSETIDLIINKFSESEPLAIGGNTTCVELCSDDKIIIFDMGSGLRKLGNSILQESNGITEFHIFLSHTHWDHIHGLPFFVPAYMPQFKLHFYSVHPGLQERLEIQQDLRFFPVRLDQMASSRDYTQLTEDYEITIGNLTIKNQKLYHPGNSYGYSVTNGQKKFVYATDAEYINLSTSLIQKYIEFFKGADVLYFDSQYSFSEAIHKADWGHSSAIIGIDLASDADIRKIYLSHHEPENDTLKLMKMYTQALQYKKINYPLNDLEIFLAQEGRTVEI
ncbi:MAG: MBL fold metallo-hydrolase [Ignavibacteria bacterium]